MSDLNIDAKSIQNKALPIIDVTGLLSPDTSDRRAIGDALRNACLDSGFFYVTGHGVSSELRTSVLKNTQEFFSLPRKEKEKINLTKSRCNRGYEPLKGQTLEPGQPPDLKEGFYIGQEISENDERVRSGKFNHGPNQWPSSMPSFELVMLEYYLTMLELGRVMMQGLALSLRPVSYTHLKLPTNREV